MRGTYGDHSARSEASGITRIRDSMRLIPMRQRWLAFFLLIVALAAWSRPVSTNSDDYVGEYIFTPVNADSGKFADFVILKKDHSGIEIRFSKNTGQVSTAETQWHLDHGLNEELAIGNFAHSIEGPRTKIKLGISDAGEYYEKIR